MSSDNSPVHERSRLFFQDGQKQDRLFARLVMLAGASVLVILGGIIVVMIVGGWHAFSTFGLHFFTSTQWNPVTHQFGALAPLFGTLGCTFLALLMAVPLSFATAYWLTELAPSFIIPIIDMLVQLLAAVPSIIFGMWGFFVVVPFISHDLQPFTQHVFGHVPVIHHLVDGPPFGTGLFAAGLVLAIMIIPSITAVMRDVFISVPTVLRESGYGLGATRWEVMRFVILPFTKQGIIGSILLGMGRAMGETMAVTFVVGDSNHIGWSFFSPANTIASLIALEFPESAFGSLKASSLMALGAILMALSFFTLWISQRFIAPPEKSKK